MNTLRGVFPEPPIIPKRNFIKENVIQIKRMQGYLEEIPAEKVQTINKKTDSIDDVNQQNIRTMKLIRNTKKQIEGLTKLSQEKAPKFNINNLDKNNKNLLRKKSIHATECPYYKTAVEAFRESQDTPHRVKEMSTQTEQFCTLKQLYENGTIKYPSIQAYCNVAHNKTMEKARTEKDKEKDKDMEKEKEKEKEKDKSTKHKGDGDGNKRKDDKSAEQKVVSADGSPFDKKHDYVRENAQIIRTSSYKSGQSRNVDPTKAPPTYQKGVVPKYLRERKVKPSVAEDEKCPEGHVILPDNERKETLRMLRQSYAELVAELNQLPVRSDTLKIRSRKIELENHLKKIDEGIKVFTRPKVYVKIGV